jgi:hypothetical protein
MVIGWGSYSFQRYDPGAKIPTPQEKPRGQDSLVDIIYLLMTMK